MKRKPKTRKPVLSDMQLGLRELLAAWDDDQRCGKQPAVRDLLTDLRHYCDVEQLDFYAACDGSYKVYLEERGRRRPGTAANSKLLWFKVTVRDCENGVSTHYAKAESESEALDRLMESVPWDEVLFIKQLKRKPAGERRKTCRRC